MPAAPGGIPGPGAPAGSLGTMAVNGEALGAWYVRHGRHDLPWRPGDGPADRWVILVSEVMLAQTGVSRVRAVWDGFIGRFGSPEATARAGPAAVIAAWGRLGYPRRARWLWEAADRIATGGWPADLRRLPGVGPYTAAAVAAIADGTDTVGVDVNVRRVTSRLAGEVLADDAAAGAARRVAGPLHPRHRQLALIDLGATVCTARNPDCGRCPLSRGCRGPGLVVRSAPQRPYAGSFRQRRGGVLAALRDAHPGGVPAGTLDAAALASLVDDGLATVTAGTAHLPA